MTRKNPHIDEQGYVLYYTYQCPFNAKYVPVIENLAKEHGVQFKSIHLQTKEETQNAPTPITTYALFYNGSYVTNEQMNDKRFQKLIEEMLRYYDSILSADGLVLHAEQRAALQQGDEQQAVRKHSSQLLREKGYLKKSQDYLGLHHRPYHSAIAWVRKSMII